jgi:hypothetical protein
MLVVASASLAGVGSVAAQTTPTITAESKTVTPSSTTTIDVTVDDLPNGVQTYNITVSLSDASVATVAGAEAGDVGGFQVRSSTDSSITVRAADLAEAVESGSSDVVLATVELTNTAQGQTDVDVGVNTFTDDNGNSVNPATQSGTLTVQGSVQPASTISASPARAGATSTHRVAVTVGSGADGSTLRAVEIDYAQAFVDESGSVAAPAGSSSNVVAFGVDTDGDGTVDADASGSLSTSGDDGTLTVETTDTPGPSISAGDRVIVEYSGVQNPATGGDYGTTVTLNPAGDDEQSSATLGITAAPSSGAPTVSVSDANVSAGSNAMVDVTIDAVPDGLRAFNVTVALADGSVADVAGVQRGDLSLASSQARSENSISFEGVDLAQSVNPGDTDVVIGTVELNNTVQGQTDVTVTVNQLRDDNGTAITPQTQSGTLTVEAGGELFTEPVVGGGAPPTDPDDDGLYEDVNGDGQIVFQDAVDLGIVAALGPASGELSAEQEAAFDFDGNGEFGFQDAVDLGIQIALG